jgi:histidine triad (HIT) family protein
MSLSGAYDHDNIFARMLRGDVPCHRVLDDEVALAFMDIFPQAPGHTLVIPRIAARNLLDFPPDALGPYMMRVQRVAAAVERAMKPDGLMITQFNGAPAGQTVFHLHFHIIPRFEGQALGRHGAGAQAEAETLKAQANAIARALA